MIIGAKELLEKYGSPLAVAEALLKGEISSYQQQFVSCVVDDQIMEAAKFRIANNMRTYKSVANAWRGLQPITKALPESTLWQLLDELAKHELSPE